MGIEGSFRRTLLLSLGLLFTGWLSPVAAISDVPTAPADNCIACHKDVWRYIQSKKYAHQPDSANDCKYCHTATRGDSAAKREPYLNKAAWVARSATQAREHWLEIDGAKRGATLLVESNAAGCGGSVREFPLPALEELEELPSNDSGPLKISNIRVLEVAKGVFVSTTIGWETDRQADSQVFYGYDKLDQRSALDAQYTLNHAVVLNGVKLGKNYRYKVISVDVAGNRSESNVQTMAVDLLPGRKEEAKTEVRDRKEPEVSVRYYRKGNKCIVVVGSERMISVALGILPKKYERGDPEDAIKIIRHIQLNSPEVTNTGICYGCHVEYNKILTHPINVYPKRGMSIPPEYATLPDGRISCMSCHVAHASNVEFRLVKADRRDLCRGCHQDIS